MGVQIMFAKTGVKKCGTPFSAIVKSELRPMHSCKSHDHEHQWANLVMTWLPLDKSKREHKVVRIVRDLDCLHFAQYISISPHGTDCNQTWCKEIYHINRVSWLNPLLWNSVWCIILHQYPQKINITKSPPPHFQLCYKI